MSEERRQSPRIKIIHAIKKPNYGDNCRNSPTDEGNKKSIKGNHRKQESPPSVEKGALEEEGKRCKRGAVCDTEIAKSSKTNMLQRNEILYPERNFGNLPDIQVGHRFYSRDEMVAIGFHGHWLNGIDYMGISCDKLKRLPLAVAIVMSGQEEDDVDNSEEIVYTDQGGNDLAGNKHQVKNHANLALKNNMEQSIPVRVIRSFDSDKSHTSKVYRYDGLYKVNQYWNEKGVSGFNVLKYRLRRLSQEAELTLKNQVHFAQGQDFSSKLHGLVCKDISNGKEAICIPAINVYDDVAPTGFEYIKSIQVAKNVEIPLDAPGCNCKVSCDSKSCSCAQLNGLDFAYVEENGGRLKVPKDVVFECGPNCGCGPSCVNRTSQRGLRYQLEVYRTPNKGWAVRSLDFIPSGAPVCEYTGVLRKSDELDNVSENDYIFEIDCWQTMNEIEGRERRLGDVSLPTRELMEKIDNKISEKDNKISESVPEFCIDAGSFGNVARFINHSCDPNLFVQCVLSSHQDIRLARVVLFAADDIPAMEELTYDYNYALDSVIGPDGEVKEMPCYCGAADCRKRLY